MLLLIDIVIVGLLHLLHLAAHMRVNFVYRLEELILVTPAPVSDTEWCEAELLKDVLSNRDDESEIMFADSSGLELSHLNCLLYIVLGRLFIFYMYFEYDFIIK